MITWLRWLESVSISGDAPVTSTFSRQLADRHLQVDAHAGADLHLHVVDERDREARFLGGDDVDAGLDGDEFVGAVGRGRPRQRDAGRGVGQRDLGVRARRAPDCVADRADDRRGFELRARRRGAREQQDQAEQDTAARNVACEWPLL